MFAGLKIPRAHATDTSGSEEMTESVHTDYGTDVSSIPSMEVIKLFPVTLILFL